MASNIQRGPRRMDASDWVRLKRLYGARNFENDKSGDVTNPAPRLETESGRRVYTEFGTSKIRRPASNYTDYISSQTVDYVLEESIGSCGAGKALTVHKVCTCTTSSAIKHNGLCISCKYDRVVNRGQSQSLPTPPSSKREFTFTSSKQSVEILIIFDKPSPDITITNGTKGSFTLIPPGKVPPNSYVLVINNLSPNCKISTSGNIVGLVLINPTNPNNLNFITDLDVSKLVNLTDLNCDANKLTSLDVSKLVNLSSLSMALNPLTKLDVSNCKNLTRLEVPTTNLTTLDVSSCKNLVGLSCDDSKLKTLDVSGLAKLETLSCYQNNLTSLNVSGCVKLETLSFYQNNLKTLDVSGLAKLEILRCFDNKLTSLNVSGLAKLETLECYQNNLTSLNVSGCTNLTALQCQENNLNTINVSGLAKLTYLGCYENNLTFTEANKILNALLPVVFGTCVITQQKGGALTGLDDISGKNWLVI
jgi:hypothetical protein